MSFVVSCVRWKTHIVSSGALATRAVVFFLSKTAFGLLLGRTSFHMPLGFDAMSAYDKRGFSVLV